MTLQEFAEFDSATQAKKNVVRAIEVVSEKLGNTPSICRKCYVHPAVIEAYLEGTLVLSLRQARRKPRAGEGGLAAEEIALLAFLRNRCKAGS